MGSDRDTRGQFTEGNQCAAGRKGAYIPIQGLISTFERLSQEKHNKSFLEFICDKAFTDNKLLTALLKMMVEKQAVVVDVYDNSEWATKAPSDIVAEMDVLTASTPD